VLVEVTGSPSPGPWHILRRRAHVLPVPDGVRLRTPSGPRPGPNVTSGASRQRAPGGRAGRLVLGPHR